MRRALRVTTAALTACVMAVACAAPATEDTGLAASDLTDRDAPDASTGEPDGDRPPADSPDAGALAEGLNNAGARLFLAAAEGADGDVVISPFSIGTAFGMADVGATDGAARDLADLFGYPVEGEARWSAFNTLLRQVTESGEHEGGPVLTLANRQFPDEGFALAPAFDEAVARWFGAAAQPLPLQEDPDGSRDVINAYVADRTEDLIPELLPAGLPTPDTVLVLVNALYLAADWATPFGKYPTTDADFTGLDGSTTTVALMNDKEVFGPAVDGPDYVAVERPYQGGELSMVVIVPDDGAFEAVQARLSDGPDGGLPGEGLLAEVDATATDQAVDLYLPRFASTTDADLRDLIENGLGLTGIFTGGYEGIAPGIELTSAVHAADIEVDEIGTIAAAATALGFEDSGPGEPDLVVRADRPFLYAIRHLPTGAVLFLGRVMDPAT